MDSKGRPEYRDMKNLAERFIESKGQPIDLEGETIVAIHRMELAPGEYSLRLRRISANEDREPGLAFRVKGGSVLVADQRLEKFNIWAKTSPQDFSMTIVARRSCQLSLWNIWSARGVTEAWIGQAGMKITTQDGTSVVECSGGSSKPDFTALVIELQLQKLVKTS